MIKQVGNPSYFLGAVIAVTAYITSDYFFTKDWTRILFYMGALLIGSFIDDWMMKRST
ncbi:MAG: hypothetical protein JRE40_00210 [Deltaproteobacteria bacterium]|nr:hypothetical protein [Deltaproteobacteria bacterium]